MDELYHVFRGKRYRIRFSRMYGNDDGLCESPQEKDKTIVIKKNQPIDQEIITVIHESLHACLWDLDEEAVDAVSTDIGKLLDKLYDFEKKGSKKSEIKILVKAKNKKKKTPRKKK